MALPRGARTESASAAYTFSRGGGMVTSSSIDLSPRSLATPGHGAWKRTGKRATAGLDATGNTWSGNFTFDVVAPNGATVFSGGGTHSATRIRPEPL